MAGKGKQFHHLKPELVAEALSKARGIVSKAAEMLECTPRAIYLQMEENPIVKEAKEMAEEKILDVAESKLHEAVDKGDRWGVHFVLSTKGRKRGYHIPKDSDAIPLMLTEFTLNLGNTNTP